MQFNKYIHTYIHTYPPREDQCEWHRMTRMTGPDCVVRCNLINTYIHTSPREDQCEWHRMTRMTGPDCVVMCNLINTYIHTYIHIFWLGMLSVSTYTHERRPYSATLYPTSFTLDSSLALTIRAQCQTYGWWYTLCPMACGGFFV